MSEIEIEIEMIYPLSLMQEGMLFHSLMDLKAKQNVVNGSILGWKNWIKGEVTIIETSGTHQTIMNSPNVEHLARHMNRIMRGICENA